MRRATHAPRPAGVEPPDSASDAQAGGVELPDGRPHPRRTGDGSPPRPNPKPAAWATELASSGAARSPMAKAAAGCGASELARRPPLPHVGRRRTSGRRPCWAALQQGGERNRGRAARSIVLCCAKHFEVFIGCFLMLHGVI
jgi:hypothetical protein